MFDNDYANIFTNISKIYAWMSDDISKSLFLSRMEHNITNTKDSLHKILNFAQPNIKKILPLKNKNIDTINPCDNQPIIIYGAGGIGRNILPELKNRFPDTDLLFCDKNHDQIKTVENISVISPHKLISSYKNCKVLIATSEYFHEVYDFLANYNIDAYIIRACDDTAYFVDDIIKLSHNEVFVDAGVLNGKTTLDFAKLCNFNYKKIYMFEPDDSKTQTILSNTKHLDNTQLFKLGLWDKKDILTFTATSDGLSHISQISQKNGNTMINVDTLDNICNEEPITFIKMDIEGAELNALKGAKNIIQRYKPKLAISCYHKPEDIIALPLFIKALVPQYKLYMRHHGSEELETVLYAIIP